MWTDHSWNDLLKMVMLSLLLSTNLWLVPKVLVSRSESILVCGDEQTEKSMPGGRHDHGGVPSEANFMNDGLLLHQAPCTSAQVNSVMTAG